MIIARLLYDVLRSHDCEGAKCYMTHLFIGSQCSLTKLQITTIFFSTIYTSLYFYKEKWIGGLGEKNLKGTFYLPPSLKSAPVTRDKLCVWNNGGRLTSTTPQAAAKTGPSDFSHNPKPWLERVNNMCLFKWKLWLKALSHTPQLPKLAPGLFLTSQNLEKRKGLM